MVIGKHAGVYQQAQGRMYAVKLLIGEGRSGREVKDKDARIG